jgi:signal transduction histidine kinase
LGISVSELLKGVDRGITKRRRGVFTQGDESSTRMRGGVGLGLTISSRFAEKMGGRIWVGSELGTGSKFHFTFRQGVRRTGSRKRHLRIRVFARAGARLIRRPRSLPQQEPCA